jgi:hypothetical protein
MIDHYTFIPRNGAYHKHLEQMAVDGHPMIRPLDAGFYVDGIGIVRLSEKIPVPLPGAQHVRMG